MTFPKKKKPTKPNPYYSNINLICSTKSVQAYSHFKQRCIEIQIAYVDNAKLGDAGRRPFWYINGSFGKRIWDGNYLCLTPRLDIRLRVSNLHTILRIFSICRVYFIVLVLILIDFILSCFFLQCSQMTLKLHGKKH